MWPADRHDDGHSSDRRRPSGGTRNFDLIVENLEDLCCPSCHSESIERTRNYGSVRLDVGDDTTKKYDNSDMACRACATHLRAAHPWIVQLDGAVEAAATDVIESFTLALRGAGVSGAIQAEVLTTARDAVSNHFDELLAHFDGTIVQRAPTNRS